MSEKKIFALSNTDMIKSKKYLSTDFYFTIKSRKTCKKEKIEYVSPMEYTISKCSINDIVIRRQSAGVGGKTYNSYGIMSFDKLKSVWTDNNHFYEILKDSRKPYFDIEYTTEKNGDFVKILDNVIKMIQKSFNNLGVKVSKKDIAMSYVKGIGEEGLFKNKKKHSIHLIINNGFCFKNQKDIKLYSQYLEELLLSDINNGCIDCDGNIAIDFSVYGKNQAFKLPFNSKVGSNRTQKIIGEYHKTLNSFLISYDIDKYKVIDCSTIELSVKEKVRKIKARKGLNVGNWSIGVVSKFMTFMETKKDYETIPDETPSLKAEYLIKSIYNCDNMPYDIYFCLGSACKRVFGEKDGFKYWNDWTKKSNKYDKNYNSIQYEVCSSEKCGFNTLMCLASYCNPKVKELLEKPTYEFLFDDNELDEITEKKEINQRYLSNEINFTELMENKDFVFIKSPMGTGKSYSLHKLLEDYDTYHNVVYLSSRQAFSCSMANEFKKDGFVNYLDREHFNGLNPRVIVSLESIHKVVDYKNVDLLIIDESESIFNIISSETLLKNNFTHNLKVFRDMIINSKKIMIMDAYLSNRSITPIKHLREVSPDNSSYIINYFQYDEREFYECGKPAFILEIERQLRAGKRCCVVSGSRKLGEMILQYLNDKGLNTNHIFYNIKNKLENGLNVNEAWKQVELLIYSPTITCGISYDNNQAHFDNLFIYSVNKGSTHFRDIIQAHKRVRHFTDKKICICINDDFDGFNDDQYPLRKEELNEYLTSERKTLFSEDIEEDFINSIEDIEDFKDWIFNIHLFNILEMNNGQKYLRDIAYKYLQLENIKKVDFTTNYTLEQIKDIRAIPEDNWVYSKIENIDWEQYETIKWYLENNEELGDCDILSFNKFIYDKRLREDISEEQKEEVFNVWYMEELRNKMKKIKLFKQMIYLTSDKWILQNRSTDKIEFYEKMYLSFTHIEKILRKINIIEDKEIKINKTFTTLDFEELVEEYKNISSVAINQLFTDSWYNSKNDKGEKKKITTRTIHTYLNKMLKDYFNYNIVKNKTFKKRINGTCKTITEYCLKPTPYIDITGKKIDISDKCLFSVWSNEWAELRPPYNFEDEEEY